MFKILNYKNYIENLKIQHPLPTVYQEDFDEGDNLIRVSNAKETSGDELEFTVFKDNNNYYISYDNPASIHGAYDGCTYFTNLGGYHEKLKNNFDNYYSSINKNKGLPPQLLELIEDESLAIFLLSQKESVHRDIKKLTDFLINEGIVVKDSTTAE